MQNRASRGMPVLQLFMKKFKKIYCDLCGKNFVGGCDLKVHIQIVHEKDLEFKCDECGKNFTKAFNIQTIHEKK